MSDLTVDLAAVEQAAQDMGRAADGAQRVGDGHAGLSVSRAAAGSGDVAGAVDDFLSRWRYGSGLLAGDLRTLSTWLTQSAKAYRETDDALAQAAQGGD